MGFIAEFRAYFFVIRRDGDMRVGLVIFIVDNDVSFLRRDHFTVVPFDPLKFFDGLERMEYVDAAVLSGWPILISFDNPEVGQIADRIEVILVQQVIYLLA